MYLSQRLILKDYESYKSLNFGFSFTEYKMMPFVTARYTQLGIHENSWKK